MYCPPSPFPLPQWGLDPFDRFAIEPCGDDRKAVGRVEGCVGLARRKPSLTRSWVRGMAAQPAPASDCRALVEAGRAVIACRLAPDGDDARHRRAAVAGGGKGVDGRRLADGERLDAAVAQIAHPAAQGPAPRLALGPEAKADGLHAAGDAEAGGGDGHAPPKRTRGCPGPRRRRRPACRRRSCPSPPPPPPPPPPPSPPPPPP